ncbi:PadR family transcriptional regulator [Amycolatopsis sp. FDAARGOS 1241]|uniref:PadR family transcriptional regulator n=1 Tax=Amycolatopsis sp. FDAARGOS 1241 TaxID=2778070 RepID=UPI00194E5A09|nr:PadR family transcriptional regulator [Amycolatopsis sp. FDAARGOS 1241]QRP49321.1 PadR family transcriptional regulator [Amycolatopsis sp. FDAARGOS 1241]
MWIDVLLLAKLAAQPLHGYELRKQVEESSGRALSNNSLYPALRRFAEAGAVTRVDEAQEGKPPRHVYTITDVGRELLHDLLADLPADLAGDPAEFFARLAGFGRLEPEERLRVLDARERALAAQCERLAKLAAAQEDPWSRLVLAEVGRRAEQEQSWLATVRARARKPSPEEESR